MPCPLLLLEAAVAKKDKKRKWGTGGETLAEHVKRLKAKKGRMVSRPTCMKPGSLSPSSSTGSRGTNILATVGGLSHHGDAHTSSTVIGRGEILAHGPAASEALLTRRVEVAVSGRSGGGADQVALCPLVLVPPTSAGHPTAEVLPRAAP